MLCKAELVSDRKEGLWIYYRINDTLPGWVLEVIHAAARGIEKEEPFSRDAIALVAMPNRPGGICSA